jgi:hypothetical protein
MSKAADLAALIVNVNTTEAKTDELTGNTSAGSIAVTGEGGSTTTNLQQGLAKAWVNFNGTGTIAARDSLNLSSLDDDGTGSYGVNVSSVFSSANHSAHSTCDAIGNYSNTEINNVASTGIDSVRCWNDNPTTIDPSLVFATMHGDLA